MNPYVLLGAAILAELFGTTMLELSDGFSRPVPTAGVLVGYLGAFYLVSLVLEDLPLGLVYATWAALGIVGVAAIGIVLFGEEPDLAAGAGVLLIVAGVYLLNVVSDVSAAAA